MLGDFLCRGCPGRGQRNLQRHRCAGDGTADDTRRYSQSAAGCAGERELINFKHIDASSTDHALTVLEQYGEGARVLAGGQDLLFRIKKYIVKPECVVNIKTIPGLCYIRS